MRATPAYSNDTKAMVAILRSRLGSLTSRESRLPRRAAASPHGDKGGITEQGDDDDRRDPHGAAIDRSVGEVVLVIGEDDRG